MRKFSRRSQNTFDTQWKFFTYNQKLLPCKSALGRYDKRDAYCVLEQRVFHNYAT